MKNSLARAVIGDASGSARHHILMSTWGHAPSRWWYLMIFSWAGGTGYRRTTSYDEGYHHGRRHDRLVGELFLPGAMSYARARKRGKLSLAMHAAGLPDDYARWVETLRAREPDILDDARCAIKILLSMPMRAFILMPLRICLLTTNRHTAASAATQDINSHLFIWYDRGRTYILYIISRKHFIHERATGQFLNELIYSCLHDRRRL